MILNIETSSKICSVALCEDGQSVFSLESENEMDHSTKLGPFVAKCLEEMDAHGKKLDAVSVSLGPGSYTGLRIGLSMAKGLCFGRNIPLIGIPTLDLLAVKAMFMMEDIQGDELFIPLIDARRMEVYTEVINNRLEQILPPRALILAEDSFTEYEGCPIVMIGDGVKKAKELIKIKVTRWIDAMPRAIDMTALSEKYLRENRFLDLAYSIPLYLKNFQATIPKNKLNDIKN